MNKLGLVLEGGGMRGVYTAGVLDFFIDKNIYPDGILGVSAGACHACSYVSKQRGRAFKVNTDYLHSKEYMSFRSFIKTGNYFNENFLYHKIPDQLNLYDYDTFKKSNIKFYAVVSNLETGEPEYLECTDMHKDIDYVRASASLPLLSKIVEVNGKKVLDGGVCDSIPILKAQHMGYNKNIIVLTQSSNYRKGKNNLLPILKQVYKPYPKFIKALENRHMDYNNTLKRIENMEKNHEVFVIRPSSDVTIHRLEKNVDRLKDLYQQGYDDAKNCYQELLAFLNQ